MPRPDTSESHKVTICGITVRLLTVEAEFCGHTMYQLTPVPDMAPFQHEAAGWSQIALARKHRAGDDRCEA